MLEDLLKPVKALDQEVLRQYTKLSEKYNIDQGNRKYKVAFLGFEMTALAIKIWSNTKFPDYNPIVHYTADLNLPLAVEMARVAISPILFFQNADTLHNFYGIKFKKKSTNSPTEKVVDKFESICQKITRPIRFPLVAYAAFNAGMALTEIYSAINDHKPLSVQGYFYISESIFSFGMASSIYIKDTDPKLLQKDPYGKEHNSITDTIKEYLPRPSPQPIPISRTSTI